MSQKIVIKANVKREPQNSVPNVSYEWHWRRIASVSMLVAMTSAAVVYGLTSSVNAEQGKQPNEQSPYSPLSDNTADNVEPTVSVNEEQARPNELTNDIADVAPAVLEDESVNNTSLAQSNNEQNGNYII
jgi:negative regulator of sigma E activity